LSTVISALPKRHRYGTHIEIVCRPGGAGIALSPQLSWSSCPLIVALGLKPASMNVSQWYFALMNRFAADG